MCDTAPPLSIDIRRITKLRLELIAVHRNKITQSGVNIHRLRIGIANPIPTWIQCNRNFLCRSTYACRQHSKQAHCNHS